MTDIQKSDPDSPGRPEPEVRESSHPEMEEYAGGTIQSIHGYIPVWLLLSTSSSSSGRCTISSSIGAGWDRDASSGRSPRASR